MDADTYDVVVIGAGPVGENVADRVVQGGLSAAIIERARPERRHEERARGRRRDLTRRCQRA